MKRYRFLRVLKIALFATVAVAVVSFVVMTLWNVLMPGIFAVRAISFWQAVGLLVLSKLLFGSFRPYRGGGPRWRRRMLERWEQMTPEEREKFKQGMRRGCGPPKRRSAKHRSRGAGMSSIHFIKTELASAVARGVRQCVVIGSGPALREAFKSSPDPSLQIFAVDEEQSSVSPATFVPTQFASEALATALEKVDFDKRKGSLFVWLCGAGYRTIDAVIASLSFIASLPRGSGVVFNYAVERTSLGSLTHSALDALASRILLVGGRVKYLIQPQAVAAMLRGLGFQQVVDLVQEELPEAADISSAQWSSSLQKTAAVDC